MVKNFITVAMLAFLAIFANAQQMQELPLNPDVKHGTLPNGLQYYILHNEQPKERANFYIAQKVGSTLETQDQLGLAHFLEHMAFNGTTHYPGKNMLNYLQSKGIRFGADINAGTNFDETVYNINNVPTTDKQLVDSVLLALYDWSCEILLEEDEINAERGVIEEEWRSRNDANFRMIEQILPKLYKEYQYQQLPIGKMEVVRSFSPETLRAYYKKWYRPDLQGIIVVGDFDAAEMETKVKELFSKVKMPENPAARTYPTVSDNKEPIFVYFEDAELQFPRVDLAFKTEKIPFEMRNTIPAYVQNIVLERIVSSLINNRLSEYQQNPKCKYAIAVVNFGDYYVSKTKGAFNVIVIGKADGSISEAFNEAMSIVARACKTGFTESELKRVKDEMLSSYEKAFNERKNTYNEALGQELIRYFIDNVPAPGIENELSLIKQILPSLNVAIINQAVTTLLTPENQVLAVSVPKKDGMEIVTEEKFITNLNEILNKEYEAYVDEVITDPLIANQPKAGKINAQSAGKFDTQVFELSNGVKVVIKPTDFKSDEILMTAFRNGGIRSYAPSQAANVKMIPTAFQASKFGNFDNTKLQKYLAGKRVGIGYSIGNTVNSLAGTSTVKDLPTLMELIYTAFTNLNPDDSTYNSQMDLTRTLCKSYEVSPERIFSAHLLKARFGNNPMFNQQTVKSVEEANYTQMLSMIKESMKNAADYTFIFTGNVNIDSIKPLLEKYIASLPGDKKKKASVKDLSSISYAKGQISDIFKQEMKTPSTQVFNQIGGSNIPYSIENSVKMEILGDILANVYVETLREEEGGTYSPYSAAGISPYTGDWQLVYLFQTSGEKQEKLRKRAYDECLKLMREGASETNFNKVREAALKQYDIMIRTNNYWNQNLIDQERGIDTISGHKAAIENLTLTDFNKFIKNLYDGKNRIEVVMEGVAESK